MTENANQPTISADYADYVRQTATQIERDNPADPAMMEHAAKLRASIEGLAPPPVTDPRSQQQRLYDKAYGCEPRQPSEYDIDLQDVVLPDGTSPAQVADDARQFLAAMQVSPTLGAMIVRDLLSDTKPDPEQVAQAIDAVGVPYQEALRDAQYVLDRGGAGIGGKQARAADLGTFALVQAALFGRHLRKWAASRPA